MDSHEQIVVKGMTCSSCAMSVSTYLLDSGLENIDVDLESGIVSYNNPEEVNSKEISDGIKNLGYSVSEEAKLGLTSKREFWFVISMLFTIPLLLHMFLDWHVLHNPYVQFSLALPVLIIGIRYFGKSALSFFKTGTANMDVLIMMGSLSAFIYSCIGIFLLDADSNKYLFFETSASIISLVMLGNIIEHRAIKKTKSAVESMIKLQPKIARMITGYNTDKEKIIETEVKSLLVGDIVQVNSGDQIPVDGIVISGTAKVDESGMTGESDLISMNVDSKTLCGTFIAEGNLTIRVKKTGNHTALAQIIKLMQDAQFAKPAIQKLADKISAWFVPLVLAIAAITFIISYFIIDVGIGESMMRSIAVMVISCPCAMGLATPTAVAVGIGKATSRGLLVKNPNTLELIDKANIYIFDKTGTLTKGGRTVTKIEIAENFKRENIIGIITELEKHSTHPIAKDILNHTLQLTQNKIACDNISEIEGKGIKANLKTGESILLGSKNYTKADGNGDVFLLIDDTVAASIYFSADVIKEEAYELIDKLHSIGIKTVLLSGDKNSKSEIVAKELGIKEWYGEQLPDQKLNLVKKYNEEGITVMVGDGINDAPPLEQANIAISINDASQIAVNAADIIVSNKGGLRSVLDAKKVGKHTYLTIKQNLLWALLYNVVAIPLAAAGFLSPIIGVIAMAFSDLVVIGNSIRLRTKKIF